MDDLIIEDFAKRGYQRVNPALGMAGHRNILNDMEQNYSTNLNTNDIIYSIEDYYL